MAASTSVTIINPRSVWIGFSVLAGIVFLISGYSLLKLSEKENQKLVNSQWETLIRSRYSDLESRSYRNFVEGIGNDFSELSVEVKERESYWSSPGVQYSQYCKVGDVQINSSVIQVKICRDEQTSSRTFGFLIFAYLIVSAISLVLVNRIEQNSIASLLSLFQGAGVRVESEGGLSGLLSQINSIKAELESVKRKEIHLAQKDTMIKLATQVAHDIRSPIALLSVLSKEINELPEEARNLINVAIVRIKEIAQTILNKSQSQFVMGEVSDRLLDKYVTSEPSKSQSVSKTIEAVILEKRIEFRESGIAIDLYLEDPIKGALISYQENEFIRMISNLINNAKESMALGVVSIRGSVEGEYIKLEILDEGTGFTSKFLLDFQQDIVLSNKLNGNGFGLRSAKQLIESWKGKLVLSNRELGGASVVIYLPVLLQNA